MSGNDQPPTPPQPPGSAPDDEPTPAGPPQDESPQSEPPAEEPAQAEPPAEPPNEPPEDEPSQSEPPKKTSNGLLIGVVAAVLVLLLGGGGLALALMSDDDDDKKDEETTSVEDFCAVITDMNSSTDTNADPSIVSDALREAGTPEDMGDDEQAGRDLFIEIGDDASDTEAAQKALAELGADDQAKVTAFGEYVSANCVPTPGETETP